MAWNGCGKGIIAAPDQTDDSSGSRKLCNKLTVLSMMLLVVSTNVKTGTGLTLEQEDEGEPSPKLWPEQFHAILLGNNTNTSRLQINDLWYDWSKGLNLNIIQRQLGERLYDVEWNNGTSFYYTLDGECNIMDFGVGIPRPDWLVGSTYLGQRYFDTFLCNVWQKVDFIWYYEDVVSKRPVYWQFYDGLTFHVQTFEVGVALKDSSQYQAPAYCFDKHKQQQEGIHSGPGHPLRRPDTLASA